MHTTNIRSITDDTENPSQPDEKPGWPRWAVHALAWLRQSANTARRFVETDPAGAASLLGAAAGVVLTAVLAVGLFAAVLQWAVSGNALHDIQRALPAVRIVTDPIGHWMTTHTAGLPLSTQAASWIWGLTGTALFLAASCRHLGAQLLWPLYGAATAALAWMGTETPSHRPVVVGLIAAAWSVLSLLALRGRPHQRVTRRLDEHNPCQAR